jgi:hypothetical protein
MVALAFGLFQASATSPPAAKTESFPIEDDGALIPLRKIEGCRVEYGVAMRTPRAFELIPTPTEVAFSLIVGDRLGWAVKVEPTCRFKLVELATIKERFPVIFASEGKKGELGPACMEAVGTFELTTGVIRPSASVVIFTAALATSSCMMPVKPEVIEAQNFT